MRATQARTRANELALLAVIATVVMLFAAFTAAYLIRRTDADWQRVELPRLFAVNTLILLASSLTMEGAKRRRRGWLTATALLGLAFLVGQFMAWRQLASQGVFLPTSPHSSFLYMLTAIHGLHLVGGLAAIIYAVTRRSVLNLVAVYWHFIGAVWLYVLMLLGTL
jgi:cytochrome c oxidase subunit 3